MERSWEQAEAGLVAVRVDADVPEARWDRSGREAGLVQLWLDGAYHQDIILARGEDRGCYERLVGRLDGGRHTLEIRPAPVGAPVLPTARIHGVEVVPLVPRDRWEAMAWEQAPVLWTRGESDPWESLSTDTPLALFYRPDGDGVEFQCIFSHEDAGTDTRGLLAQWGRTTDIEWILALAPGGAATYQGPGHRTLSHGGHRELGRLALSVVGRHGMVSDTAPRGAMRCLFLPRFRWDPRLPRETSMEDWMYRLTAMELARQGRLPVVDETRGAHIGDLGHYLFLQLLRSDEDAPAIPLDIQVLGQDGALYRSSGGDWSQAVARRGPWATTVRIPPAVAPAQILAVPSRPLQMGRIRLALYRGFRLDSDLLPAPEGLPQGRPVDLLPGADRVTLWP